MNNLLIELSNVINFFNLRFTMTILNKERTTFLLLSDKPIFNFDFIRAFLIENELTNYAEKEINYILILIDNFLKIKISYDQLPTNIENDLRNYSYQIGNNTYTCQTYNYFKYCYYLENTIKNPKKENFENLISENLSNEKLFFYNVGIGFMTNRVLELRGILKVNNTQINIQPETVKNDEIKKELHNNIFINNSFEIWERYKDNKEMTSSSATDLRVIFELMKKDKLIVDTVELKHYINWLNKIYFNNDITTLRNQNLESKPNRQRASDYKEYKKSTLKQP